MGIFELKKNGGFFVPKGGFPPKKSFFFFPKKITTNFLTSCFLSPVGRQSSRGLSQHRGEEQTAIHGEEVGEKRGRVGWVGGCVIDKNGVGGRFL